MNKFLIGLTALFLVFLSASVSAYHIAVTNDGFGLYLSEHSPTPYNDPYYYNSYTVSPNYYGHYPSNYAYAVSYGYPTAVTYAAYGNYAYWYGGYYGYVAPVYGYYNFAPAYQYQYYVYQPMPVYCTAYWCYA